MKLGEVWRKFWYLLWEDNSIKGWIFALIFLFIFVKLIFFPALNLITGTELPLAIVESCSMYHKHNLFYNFNDWYQEHNSKYSKQNIDQNDFEKFGLRNGFNKGDILFVIKSDPEKLKVGDVIVFDAGQRNPLIHRIIEIKKENGEYIFTTLGDNNAYSFDLTNNNLGIDETNIKEEQLIGKAVLRIAPYAGWGKLVFYDWMKTKEERGFCQQN